MEISIQTSGLHLSRVETDALREHVHKRIKEAFARVARRISHVSVHLEDVDGPRGGARAMHCLVKVGIGGATEVRLVVAGDEVGTALGAVEDLAGDGGRVEVGDPVGAAARVRPSRATSEASGGRPGTARRSPCTG